MQIKRLEISDHKCLVDFKIRMMIDHEKGSSTILIGENGTGKSTMLKTVLEIMMSFGSDAIEKGIKYDYEIEYYYKGSDILISKSERSYYIKIDDDFSCSGVRDTVNKKLEDAGKSIIPERISYFYAGLNDYSFNIFRRTNIEYNNECRNQLTSYWNALYLANHQYQGEFKKRRFNYCDENFVPAYLVSILCGGDTYERHCVIEQCHITAIDTISVSIIINDTLRNKLSNDILEIGEEGVLDLISFIDDRFTECFRRGFLYQNDSRFVFELHEIDAIDADSISFFNFFEKLVTLLNAKLEPFVLVGDTRVSCNDLSEGQRQLIKILGMLGICKSEDTLVLMDEPDAHMNPKWKYDLKEIIDSCLEDAVNTQAIIATHDPLVINGVDRRFIRVFTHNPAILRDNHWYITKVIEPTEKTEGMGIDGLLQSEYYGMPSVLDIKTKEKMHEKQSLLIKKVDGTITEQENQKLIELSENLEDMAFARNIPTDSYYDEYVAAMHRIYKEHSNKSLTREEIAERNAKAEEILRELLSR